MEVTRNARTSISALSQAGEVRNSKQSSRYCPKLCKINKFKDAVGIGGVKMEKSSDGVVDLESVCACVCSHTHMHVSCVVMAITGKPAWKDLALFMTREFTNEHSVLARRYKKNTAREGYFQGPVLKSYSFGES